MSKQKNVIAVLFIAILALALVGCNAAQAGSTAIAGGGTVVGQGTA